MATGTRRRKLRSPPEQGQLFVVTGGQEDPASPEPASLQAPPAASPETASVDRSLRGPSLFTALQTMTPDALDALCERELSRFQAARGLRIGKRARQAFKGLAKLQLATGCGVWVGSRTEAASASGQALSAFRRGCKDLEDAGLLERDERIGATNGYRNLWDFLFGEPAQLQKVNRGEPAHLRPGEPGEPAQSNSRRESGEPGSAPLDFGLEMESKDPSPSERAPAARVERPRLVWGREIGQDELRDPEKISELYGVAVLEGVANPTYMDQLAFFALVAHVLRQPDIGNCVALLTSILNGTARDKFGRDWRARPTNGDEDTARELLRRLELGDEFPEKRDRYLSQLEEERNTRIAEAQRKRDMKAALLREFPQ